MDKMETSLENWKKSKKVGIEIKNQGFFRKPLWIFHFFRNFSKTEKNQDFLGILGTLDSLRISCVYRTHIVYRIRFLNRFYCIIYFVNKQNMIKYAQRTTLFQFSLQYYTIYVLYTIDARTIVRASIVYRTHIVRIS